MRQFKVPSPISVLQSQNIIRLLHIFTCKPSFPVYKEHKGLTYPWSDVVSFSSGIFHQRTSQKITRFFIAQIFCTCQWILMKVDLYNEYGDQTCIFYISCSFSDALYQTHICIYSWHNEPQMLIHTYTKLQLRH